MKSINYLSWIVLGVGILAWGCVVYYSVWLEAEARERGGAALSAQKNATDAAHLKRVEALARDTAGARERLETFARADIVSTADTIEAAGKDLGVRARVEAALPSGSPQEIPGGMLHTITFVVQAEGSFSGIVRLVKVFEQFPAFSHVEQFDFERAGEANPSGAWRATIRLTLRTTSDTSL